MLHRPGDAYSVDLFWNGPHREFSGWYINLQDPIRRHERGFDTLDHELDYWLPSRGSWTVKDDPHIGEMARATCGIRCVRSNSAGGDIQASFERSATETNAHHLRHSGCLAVTMYS